MTFSLVFFLVFSHSFITNSHPPSFSLPSSLLSFSLSLVNCLTFLLSLLLPQIYLVCEENPIIVKVDLVNNHLNHGFDVVNSDEMEVGVLGREGYHVRQSVFPLDYDSWHAYFPTHECFAKQFSVFFRGPAKDYLMRQTAKYIMKVPEGKQSKTLEDELKAKEVQCNITDKTFDRTNEFLYFQLVSQPMRNSILALSPQMAWSTRIMLEWVKKRMMWVILRTWLE